MPATFTVSEDGTYLTETFIGNHTAEMFRVIAEELRAQMRQTGIVNVLVDIRAQQAPLPILDAYQLWNDLALRIPVKARLAVLVTWKRTGPTFAETVALNHGVRIRNFDDEGEALA